MRPIDADALELILNNAIEMMRTMAKALDSEDDPEIQMEIKAYTDILTGVKEQPTVQPERKRGKWIGGDGSYICSECSSSPMDFIGTMGVSFDAYVETPMHYCPNCGADMRGEQDE